MANNTYEVYPMVLNNVFIGMIGLRSDQKRYYGIPEPTAQEEAKVHYQGEIAGHRRNIFSKRLDDQNPTRTIEIKKVTAIDRDRSKTVASRGGKPIKIPTQLQSTPAAIPSTDANNPPPPRTPSTRYTTIKFPQAASNGEISRWLHAKCVEKKPLIFKTPAGQTHRVSATGNAPVTGAPDDNAGG